MQSLCTKSRSGPHFTHLHLLPNSQPMLVLLQKDFIHQESLQGGNMPKATPSISIPMRNTPKPVPLKYKASGQLECRLGSFLLQAVDPAHVLRLLLD